ncbi:hypothetical protein swp_3977 [Shewanella piezotolerans WP3]|uniref:Uncharacterized protein n=1 Tax=Shewanella piezotolerans (strain WP3 / JCM 13877) TaxID=225849 RepID=B8CSM1_SHEPW|nr:hypothetical protein swp_3977 [Shewanella piezotolerans WP3]
MVSTVADMEYLQLEKQQKAKSPIVGDLALFDSFVRSYNAQTI